MAPRKKKESFEPDKRGFAPSGWCVASQHEGCIQKFIYSDCSCECHNAVAPKKRGRPKKVVEKTMV
jgi:hypothetical protein